MGLPIERSKGKKQKAVPVKIVSESIAADAKYAEEDRQRKARYALEDIERAEGHRKDRNLMKDVKKLAKEKVKTLGKIC